MRTAILLSPAVSAHPLFSVRELARLRKRWDGPVLSSRGSEHDVFMAGGNLDPRHLASRVLSEHPTLDDLVIVHDSSVPLGELLRERPDASLSMAVVDADAYAAEPILAAVEGALGRRVEEPW